MLQFRERQGIEAVVHVVLQSVLERTQDDDSVDRALDEIRDAMDSIICNIQMRRICSARELMEVSVHPLPLKPLSGPAGASHLSDDILKTIFMWILELEPPGPRRRCALSIASRVCSRWSRIVLSSVHFWTDLDKLSMRELRSISSLLKRSYPKPFHISAKLQRLSAEESALFYSHLGRELDRAASIDLRNIDYEVHLYSALSQRAPVLSSLSLHFVTTSVSRSVLPTNLFDRHAPSLTELSLPWSRLPAECPAFSGVTKFRSQDGHGHSPCDILFELCPRLHNVVFNSPKDIWFSRNYRPAKLPTSLEIVEEDSANQTQTATINILKILPQELISKIHIRCAAPTTVSFVRKRIGLLDSLFFARSADSSHMSIVDRDNFTRVFSDVDPTAITSLLRIPEVFAGLTSLSVGEYILSEDVTYLFRLDAPNLRRLELFVRYTSLPETIGLVHILSSSISSSWTCRALRMLDITTKDPSDGSLFADDARKLRISARAVSSFVRQKLNFGASRLKLITLSGVCVEETNKRARELLEDVADEVVM